MPIFAAVDIGANSVRLKIAQLTRRKLKVIHEDREVTRMGESVFRYNTLAPAAMAQTVKVLTRFYRAAQKFRVEQVRVVGTSALRDAKNSRAFTEWVKSAVGWKIDIISGLEEGRLIHLGVLSNLRIENKDVLMFDLGGGSCEITISEHGHIREMFTLPLGAVRLTQEFLLHDPAKSKEIVRMREYIAEQVNRIAPAIRRHRVDLAIATSGTAAALAGAARALQGRSKYSHTVSRKITAKLAQELSARSASERSQFPGIGPKRSEIIVAGAFVFAELMANYGLVSFQYSPLGLRDGVLAQMAADADIGTREHRQLEAEREDALMLLGKRFGVDARHAAHVRSLSQQLFKALKDIHRLPGEYSEWISAAAMLHELGSYVNRNGRHRHTYYLIANSELFGFSPEQRHLVAAIARYMGKSRPSERDRELRNLRPSIRELLNRAVVLLRIARALNQGRRGVVQKLRTRESGAEVTIQLLGKPDMDLEVWAAEKERTYFRDVFGRDLVVKSA
ncbi:MAG TPA: Ppx/GppA phosphatase family protein [Terriglobales bacterium]|jgi:exopolyphosphatase/guanosine-5'-triphosphate,3'-diphosphate pyrophosphatase|nr:Ppx/GppA phosphatase family protein [Terriglobales bacterium]